MQANFFHSFHYLLNALLPAEAKFLVVRKRRKRGKREEKGEERGREGGREGKEGKEKGEGGEVATIGPVARSFGWVSGRSGKRYGKRYVSYQRGPNPSPPPSAFRLCPCPVKITKSCVLG